MNHLTVGGHCAGPLKESRNRLDKESGRFSVAVNEWIVDESGTGRTTETPVWINVVVTGFALLIARDVVDRGAHVIVSGRARLEARPGQAQNVNVTVFADAVALIPKRDPARDTSRQTVAASPAPGDEVDPWEQPARGRVLAGAAAF